MPSAHTDTVPCLRRAEHPGADDNARDEEHDRLSDAAIRRDPEFIASISDVWQNGTSYKTIGDFITKLRERREVGIDEENAIASNIDRLFDLKNYPFTALEISSLVTEEQVADIFVRINSAGAKLKQSDFILTLMSVWWDEGRSRARELRPGHPNTEPGRQPITL